MGKSWHSKCFGCEVCGLNFSTAQVGFHENEGRALCENCYANNVLPKCQGCQAPITDRTMKAMGGQWHVSCFVCKVPIHTGRFDSNFSHIFKSNTKFELLY